MELYVVYEHLTDSFFGLFDDRKKADAMAEQICGWVEVEVYDLDNPKYGDNGQLIGK